MTASDWGKTLWLTITGIPWWVWVVLFLGCVAEVYSQGASRKKKEKKQK